MMCSFCSQTIEKGLMRSRGIKKVNVSLAHEEALIEHNPEEIEAGEIKRILRGLGYIPSGTLSGDMSSMRDSFP